MPVQRKSCLNKNIYETEKEAVRVKTHQEMVKNTRRGDTVVTNGGMVGKITKVVDDDTLEIEIADGVRIRQMRSMVTDVRAKGEPVKDDAASS